MRLYKKKNFWKPKTHLREAFLIMFEHAKEEKLEKELNTCVLDPLMISLPIQQILKTDRY